MDYVYKITRNFIEVENLGKVYIAIFAYKPYWSGMDAAEKNIKFWNKIVGPTERAWKQSGETPKFIVLGDDKTRKPAEHSGIYKYELPGIDFGDAYLDGKATEVGCLNKATGEWKCLLINEECNNCGYDTQRCLEFSPNGTCKEKT